MRLLEALPVGLLCHTLAPASMNEYVAKFS